MKLTYEIVCAKMAAAIAFKNGQPIKDIAVQAMKSESTIRRWIKELK